MIRLARRLSSSFRVNFATPHTVLLREAAAEQVNLATENGIRGILSRHAPAIEQLAPGMVEIVPSSDAPIKRWFISGGFAVMHQDNCLDLTALEAIPLEQINKKSVIENLAQTTEQLGGVRSEKEHARLEIALVTLQSMSLALEGLPTPAAAGAGNA